ncbi:DUF4194 domain-containing protein [Pseudoxanthomonas winnipegensis]|jgi:hypothetical protein|uniref:DUF4194 domain-containing protein n=1 Tax=Rhodanobacter denitrificans TaxID=666685 RepID=A0A2W5K5I0_9GAMM|nr:DUF4194 domain-containing protein [Pseudoxanthomonas winnipegensis]PZQ10814.1 MAG: hypothetical protein DI564_15075 [Rhodanobacter denitrificans]RZZ90245.1 DUF4194 domain-containing protein [Pseudoxanthomonas winnipegensis]HEL5340866.1 DUF4194 domain-containing protein [Stenotrophomonas maltophilia]
MSFWANAAEATKNVVTEDDFEAAANRLITEQVLYAADRGSKVAYGLIRDFERDFRRALEPLGYIVRVNSQLRYACAIPKHAKTSSVTVDQTLLALVLRKIFDEETRSGHHDENGEVACDLVALEIKYKQATGGRELATGGKLASLMQWMRRWGIARVSEEDGDQFGHQVDQPYVVIIRPGIAEVLGEAALARIALFTSPDVEIDSVHPTVAETEGGGAA